MVSVTVHFEYRIPLPVEGVAVVVASDSSSQADVLGDVNDKSRHEAIAGILLVLDTRPKQ